MLRRLVLLRHAKSAWDTDAPSDHGRPLAPRGRRDAPVVAAHLASLGWLPDLVVVSDALRAVQTWQCMAARLGGHARVELSPALYAAGLPAIRAAAASWPDDAGTVMLLGHNPGFESAASSLCGRPVTLKTASAALLEGPEATWPLALAGPWTLSALVHPRDLRR